jgi:hypothetical protein
MNKIPKNLMERKWFYFFIYILFLTISLLPLYTEKAYAYENTQDVIINLLMVVLTPYKSWGIFFHFFTLLIVVLITFKPKTSGRLFSVYIGLNFLVIGLVQSLGRTEKYGFVMHTSVLVMSVILAIIWIWVAIRGEIETSFENMHWYHYFLLPLALLSFWSPYQVVGNSVRPDFNPLLLLTSPDYGLTFCLTVPVFLYFLILFYPKINLFAFRITAFNGLLYALFNLTHWFNPATRWMGVLHIPLLVFSIFALIQSHSPKVNWISESKSYGSINK